MDRTIDVPEYRDDSTGLRFVWDDGFRTEVEVVAGSAEVLIRADAAGLTSPARHLLTLAQDGVRPGAHLHLTAEQEIDSSVDLTLERAPDGSG